MEKTYFNVYQHGLIYDDNLKGERPFIVLNHDGIKTFTDFHKYTGNPNNRVRPFSRRGDKRCTYVSKLLNYAFFTAGISSLSELTVDIGKEFLNAYGMHELPDDDEFTVRNKNTVAKCVSYIMDFYTNLAHDKSIKCNFKPDDLYCYRPSRNKYGKVIDKRVPLFDVAYIPSCKEPIYRDMPNKAFQLLFDHIVIHHTNLLGLVMHQAFAGLRPSEACNVRRPDSPLGAGIRFREINGELIGVTIDLMKELNLRSDLIDVGGIKKERPAIVPPIFLKAYKQAYDIYTDYMKDKKYEAEYGAFSVNKQGKAITYQSYYQQFRDIIKEEMIPIYINSEDPELKIYGQTLMDHSLSPHVFRHWYTAQLVLSGIEDAGTLQGYRGDASPESSLVYIKGKGDLEKQFLKVNNNTFDYIMWAARKDHYENTK